MISVMTYDELLGLARSLQGTALRTVTGREFKVGVYMDCPYFVPSSTGLGRSDGRKAAERFLERFNETGDHRSAAYKDVTRNACYLLALVSYAERAR